MALPTSLGQPSLSYVAQTFVATGDTMRSLDLMMRSDGPGESKYHLLITTVRTDGNGFHPDQILKELDGPTEPLDADPALHKVHVNLNQLKLVAGQTYAIVLDAFVTYDGTNDTTELGFSPTDTSGFFSFFQPVGGVRADHFNGDWEEPGGDIAFTAVISTTGNTIVGNNKDNRIDATHAPKGQPKASVFDDTIFGNKGEDKVFGGLGFDTLDGGKANDKLYGGDDGDTLIGGKGIDKLFGGNGEDNLLFDFKLTKAGAAKNFDKIGDFNVLEDTIHLNQARFTALALGDLPDTDTHITLENGKLFYDGIKFAKFIADQPASVDDIHFVVYA